VLKGWHETVGPLSPEGVNFKNQAEEIGWKEAVKEWDQGSFDWMEKHALP